MTQNNNMLPPLIDRELFFGNPEIASPELSPDGEYLAFLKPWHETLNIWVKQRLEPFSSARLLTTEKKRPISSFSFSRDGKQILYTKDNDGDENFNLFTVDPAAPAAQGQDAPPSRDLTGLTGVRVVVYSAPRKFPDIIYIGLNDRDKAWHDLFRIRLSTGEKTLVRENTEKISAWIFDEEGQLRLGMRTADNGDQELLRLDPAGSAVVYSCSVFETFGPERFHKDGKRVYMATNKGDIDLISLVLFDPETLESEFVESDPLNRVDLDAVMFSEVTEEILMTRYVDEKARRYFRDPALEADYRWLQSRFPGREIGIGSRTDDEQIFVITAASDIEPGEVYLFDRRSRNLNLQYRVRDKVPREALSEMRPIHYHSSDGLDITAYLTVPRGFPEKKLPLLVIPHGGPWARDYWGYNGFIQFFANRGYAVLSPNFRASTGFGKSFLNAGNGEWGRKMQDDITWGVRYLVSEGIADADRVGILGGSYGGYATLAGVAFTPDVYRAGVDIVGPSNLITLLESIPPYWEAGRKLMYTRMADPGTEEGLAWLRERSPLHQAERIRTPLMVVQGANDPRVNRAEAEQIVIALRDHGFPVEYLLAEDEGHGFHRPVNSMAMFMAIERFLAKHMNGRCQEDGPPEVVKRLGEISVDPATVVLTKPVDPAKVAAPLPASSPTPGTFSYSAKIAAGDHEIPIALSVEIRKDDDRWTVVEKMDTPMGEMTDTVWLDAETLQVTRREVEQDSLRISMTVNGTHTASGVMRTEQQEQPFTVNLGGPLFGDAAGANHAIAALRLAEGYSALYRNFDLQTQKIKLMELRVAGLEQLTVPAGTFQSWRVEIKSATGGADKTTVWISKDGRVPVKIASVLPSMGGAMLTAELVEGS